MKSSASHESQHNLSDLRLEITGLIQNVPDTTIGLKSAIDKISSFFKADAGLIFLLNADTNLLELEAHCHLKTNDKITLSQGHGIPGWVAWHAKPLLIPEVALDNRYRSIRNDTQSQMAAPLLASEGQAIGVIVLESNHVSGFTQDQLKDLSLLTQDTADAILRYWELERLRLKAKQFETLLSAGQTLVSKLEPQALFETLTRDTCRMLGARSCALYIINENRTLKLGAFSGPEDTTPVCDNVTIDSCLIATAVHTHKPVSFVNIQSKEYTDIADLPKDSSLQSVHITPVVYEGEIFGVLAVYVDKIHRFANDEKRICSSLAGLGAVALQNARLYNRVFQSEESLRKNERLTMLGLLTSEIAHEIRNPLTVLKLLHGGLGSDFPHDDPRHTDMRVISEKLDQLEAIVTRVLNFGKAPTSIHSRSLLSEIVEDTIVLVRLKLAQSNVKLSFTPSVKKLVVDVHKGQIQQVLLNLIINAMQAMPAGGIITITSADEKKESGAVATLHVSDSGTGIPEAIKDRIFDSFLSGRPDGTGLGLAIAKRVLQSHYGDITLTSTGPKGTTFLIYLPLVK